jgi:hypothetical protein
MATSGNGACNLNKKFEFWKLMTKLQNAQPLELKVALEGCNSLWSLEFPIFVIWELNFPHVLCALVNHDYIV